MVRRTFTDEGDYRRAWDAAGEPAQVSRIYEIAEYVSTALGPKGFSLFHNGGLPMLRRRRGDIWDEIVFPHQPLAYDFAVRFHLNHDGVGQVRARFWRPSTRAPKAIAAGDVGMLESPPVWSIWATSEHARTGEAILNVLREDYLPWSDLFDDPPRLREALLGGHVPLVDLSTGVELMLAEFDVREARRFFRSVSEPEWPPVFTARPAGFELHEDRLATIAAYYQL
ncbi:hypothetical protein EON82_11695 [bacterium]|nr:MAG: hypothetical protein EON82_11695 [bacterium]